MNIKKKQSYIILLENGEFLQSISDVEGLKSSLKIPNYLVFYELEQAKNFLNALIHLCITNGLTTKEYIEKSEIMQINVINEKENINEQ